MLYEKLWKNLSHKGSNTRLGSFRLPHFADPTTQKTEFPINYYWQGFQRQIENLSRAEASVIFQGIKLPQPVGGTAEIKEGIRGSYAFYTSVIPSSNVDMAFAHTETGVNRWQDFQRQTENPSQTEANVIFLAPESSQLVDETTQVEDIRASYSPYFYRDLLSVVDTEIGTNHWQNLQRQIENLNHVETDAILPEPASPQLIDETAQVEDIRASYSPYFYRKLLSVVDAEIGTAIMGFTQIWKLYQSWEQRFEISEQFDILAQREDNWDGRGSQKPTDLTLAHAKKVMSAFLDSAISAGHRCDTPSISSDGDGNVSAVWYKNERQLHLQIGEHEAEYFRVWGTNIDTEMDVDFLKPDNYLTLWKWLIGERQLHLQIGEHEAEYFRVWGTNIDTEMDVDFLKPDNYLTLWK